MQNSNYIDNILLHSQQPQFNVAQPINLGNLYNAYEGFNVAPQIAPQPQVVQPTGQPSQAVLNATQNVVPTQAQQLEENWGRVSPFNIQGHPELTKVVNLPANALHDIGEIATGFIHTATHLPEVGQSIKDYYTNLAYDPTAQTPVQRAGRAARDMYNFIYGDVTGATSQKLGDVAKSLAQGKGNEAWGKVKNLGYDVWNNFSKDPFIVSSIVAPNATMKATSGLVKGGLNTAEKLGVPVGDVAQKAAGAIQAIEAKFGNQKAKLNQSAYELSKANQRDLQLVIDNYTNGNKISPLPKNLEPLRDKFINFQNEYRNLYNDNALVNPREIAALQYVQRRTGQTMQDIRRTLAPQLELLQEGVDDVRLSFRNRLNDLEHDISRIRKETKNKDFLKDDKPITELTRDEFEILAKHSDPAELRSFYELGNDIKGVKQYLGDLARDAWTPTNITEAAATNAKYQENLSRLAGLAERTGDPMLKHLYDGMRMADTGEIGAFTMADAAIPEGDIVSNEGRRFAGKSSSREYGTASSEEVAKAYRNIHKFLDDVTTDKVRQEITRNILANGTIDGERSLVGIGSRPSDIRYINGEALANGNLVDALNTASNTAKDGAIAIDKYNLNALKSLLKPTGGAFTGALADVHNLAKESFLASMQYLGGNIMSGAFGTALESGSLNGLIKDAASAIASKGQLARELGVYREPRIDTRRFKTSGGKFIHNLNTLAGTGVARRLDVMFQNMYAEINANAQLRKLGYNLPQRQSAISNMSKTQLADVIRNVKSASMMNDRFRIIPRGAARDYLGIVNPFLDWADTATQVSAKMYADHPIIMGMANAELFGRIGYDKELQNRLGLKVYTDKLLKTYRFDDKARNGAKETTLSFIPQMTTIELFNDPSKFLAGNGAPALTAIWNAYQGKSPYGKPMLRSSEYGQLANMVQGDKRYRVGKDGRIEQINKTQADEVLSTAINSLTAAPNLFNKTVMPIGVELYNQLTGSDAKWYMPYGQSIFGSTQTGQPERSGEYGGISLNTLSTGNPNRPRTVKDIVRGLGTVYETDYYPEDIITGRQIRQLKKQGARRARRIFGEQ